MKYFYHPDHLGSASFVTDREGAVCQHIQYLPFGELFVSQRNCEFDSRYKFIAKELDNETSYTYFGARYYDSDLSSWLSVDPLSDKYPSLSPYIYSADNPIILIDPNGEKVYIVGDAADEATGYLSTDNIKVTRNSETGELSYKGKAKNNNEKLLVKAIETNNVIVNITANNDKSFRYNDIEYKSDGGSFLGNKVFYNENGESIGVETYQHISMDAIKENFDIKDFSQMMQHEVTESFLGGVKSMEICENATISNNAEAENNKIYWFAHNNAVPQPNFKQNNSSNNYLQIPQNSTSTYLIQQIINITNPQKRESIHDMIQNNK
jgi:RHS repeat-associated protein